MRRLTKLSMLLTLMLMISYTAKAWNFSYGTPAEGTVTELGQIVLYTDRMLDEMGDSYACTLTCPGGAKVTYYMSTMTMGQLTGTPSDGKTRTASGTYTLTIEEGQFHTFGAYLPCEAQTFTWTIAGGEDGGDTTPWQFSGVTPEEGKIQGIQNIALTLPDGATNVDETGSVYCMLTIPNGTNKSYGFHNNNGNGTISATQWSELTDPGTYTLTIPAGKFHINDVENEAQTFTWTISAPEPQGWEFTKNTPAGNKVDEIFQIVLNNPVGQGWLYWGDSDKVCYLTGSNGRSYTYTFNNTEDGHIVGNTSSPITTPGTYTLTIPANTFHIYASDNMSAGDGNAEQTFTWTIEATPWQFLGSTPAEGEIEGIQSITLTLPYGATNVDEEGSTYCTFTLPNGTTKQPGFRNKGNGTITATIQYSEITDPGTYTLTIPAGYFHIDGVENVAQTFTWTIADNGDTGEGWEFASISPAPGKVTSLSMINFTLPDGYNYINEASPLITITKQDGTTYSYVYNDFQNYAEPNYGSATINSDGVYTLTIPAGYLHLWPSREPCKEMTYTWRIGDTALNLTYKDATTPFETGAFDQVTLDRTFKAGYSTIAVPFDVADVTKVFGAGSFVAKYTGCELVDGTYGLTFTNQSNIKANVPYIIYCPAQVESPTFSNVTVVEKNPQTITGTPAGDGTTFPMTANYTVGKSMYGLYGVANNAKIQKGGSASTLNAYTAFITGSAGIANVKAYIDGLDDTDAIMPVLQGEEDDAIYDLSGRRVTKTLKGVYIQNGKKKVYSK